MSKRFKDKMGAGEAIGWIEKLGQWTLGLGRASSVSRVIFLFFDSLAQLGDLQNKCVWQLAKKKESAFRLTEADLRLPQELLTASEEVNELATILSQSDLLNPEFRKGIHRIVAKGTSFQFCILGDPRVEALLVGWEFDKENYSEKLLNSLLEFIVAHAQNSYKWLQKLDKTEALIYRDDLTGLYNNRFLDDSLDKEIRRSGRFQNSFSLLFIDLDNFKSINDQFGHLTGSDLLRQFGDLLRLTLRDIDSIVRYGGDEFVIVLLGTSSASGVLAGDRIRKVVAGHEFRNLSDRKPIQITCSVGVACYPEHAQTKNGLMKIADECMYKSKRKGKNSVTMFESSQDSVE